LRTLEVEETKPSAPIAADATSMWLKDLDKVEETPAPAEEPSTEDVPDWLKESEAAQAEVAEAGVPASEAGGELGWLDEVETESAASPVAADDSLPNWLRGVDEEARKPATGSLSGLPGWMRDETGEALAEPTKIEPTRPTDWQPEAEPQAQPEPPQPKPEPVSQTQAEPLPKPEPAPRKPKPPKRETATVRGTGMSNANIDTILGTARNELSRSNIPGALEGYEKLIKKGRFLDEVIFDLREALDRFPVEVSILQSLGDAYMRANRLQDALDAYTKAEELLR
jgi:tetratricopeptide (TPR) repeat protein